MWWWLQLATDNSQTLSHSPRNAKRGLTLEEIADEPFSLERSICAFDSLHVRFETLAFACPRARVASFVYRRRCPTSRDRLADGEEGAKAKHETW